MSDDGKLRRKDLYPSSFRDSTKRKMLEKYGDGNGNFINPETMQVIPADEVTFDHRRSVVGHWVNEGYDQTREERNDWFNDIDNLIPETRSRNSSKGANETLRYNDRRPSKNFTK